MLLVTRADAHVARRAIRSGEVARERAELLRRDARRARDALGREAAREMRGARSTPASSGPSRVSFSSKTTWMSAKKRSASLPGRRKTWRSASFAVSVRRGSTTTSFPPRAFSAVMRRFTSGAVMMLPFETTGFAPTTSQWSVRSMSGTGMKSTCPNISCDARMCGT